ncbi:MAG TPA: hypothetical protein VNB90_03615 [Cytophagaceae bacterium]|nr:hypothetical protein [Cytophagaceae bacterium]
MEEVTFEAVVFLVAFAVPDFAVTFLTGVAFFALAFAGVFVAVFEEAGLALAAVFLTFAVILGFTAVLGFVLLLLAPVFAFSTFPPLLLFAMIK